MDEPSNIIDMSSRVLLNLPRPLLSLIDEEWHKRRLKSRSETVRELLKEALLAARKP